jgi:hypothetical protein
MPTTSSTAAAIRGAPKRSLKTTAPIAAPTMIEANRESVICYAHLLLGNYVDLP